MVLPSWTGISIRRAASDISDEAPIIRATEQKFRSGWYSTTAILEKLRFSTSS